MYSRLFILIVIAAYSLLAWPQNSFAQGPAKAAGFSVSPVPATDPAITAKGYFVYTLNGGAGATGGVLLTNTGDAPLTVELAALDATTAQEGGSAFAASDAEPVGMAKWLSLSELRVTLEPATRKTVSFTVDVPKLTKSGQYLAGITAYVLDDATPDTVKRDQTQVHATVNVQTRYVIAVQVDVPGVWTPSLIIPSVSLIEQPSGTYLEVHLRNNGDVFLKASGSIRLTDPNSNQMLERTLEMGTFVTGTDVRYPIVWPGQPRPGKYNVKVELKYGAGKTAEYNGMIEVKSAESGASQQTPAGWADMGTLEADGARSIGNRPGEQVSQVLPGIESWMVYGFGVLVLLLVVLLALNLLRSWGNRRAT